MIDYKFHPTEGRYLTYDYYGKTVLIIIGDRAFVDSSVYDNSKLYTEVRRIMNNCSMPTPNRNKMKLLYSDSTIADY